MIGAINRKLIINIKALIIRLIMGMLIDVNCIYECTSKNEKREQKYVFNV
jgi:hypothetical protein